jgi:hypothetical protein
MVSKLIRFVPVDRSGLPDIPMKDNKTPIWWLSFYEKTADLASL